ncbi:hypothetical protein H5410_033625 [Solanum commersonii]|uniref:Uncharacterized protein n=1 Tax=Solanum commersonii TaxID=4109 RepID=A0A9J5YR67_SOLCO|nr:hypothetical protein H5410_033625 [Solanum commersonii]
MKSYFKFENWWLNVDGFEGLVHSWWNEFEVEGCHDYKLSVKLNMLKKKLKDWSKSVCGELCNMKDSLLKELADIDLAQNTRTLSEDELLVRAAVLVELEDLAKNEESRWRQKLIINGEEVKDREAIKVNMIEFYRKLYTESEMWKPSFEYVNCPRISQEEQDWLERPFTEEVLNIIKQCDGDKALGLMATP